MSCNVKTMKLLDCALIRVCVVIRSNMVCNVCVNWFSVIFSVLIMLAKNFSRHFEMFFFCVFFTRKGFDISCKLSFKETLCMEFQGLFS